MAYNTASGNQTVDQTTLQASTYVVRAIYRELVEFVDVDGDGVFTPHSNDTVERRVPLYLPSVVWSCNAYSQQPILDFNGTATNQTVYQIKSCATG
jgi:hypothetical protein